MKRIIRHSLAGIVLSTMLALAGCGGSGDEYDGFDAEISASTPDDFLTFFNRQGDLGAGSYRLVVATAAANQSGSFSVSVRRNNGSSEQLISGSWSNSFGPSATPVNTCNGNTANRCYSIAMDDASGVSITLDSARTGLMYLLDSADQVVASGANSLRFSESEIDETDFARAYYDAIDPGGARTTAQDYIAMHGLDNPDVHVIFRDSKDLGYGRDMYMNVYTNASVGSSCGPPGAVTIAFFVRNFSVQIVEGFAYGPVNLEAAIAEDLRHHLGSNAIEFGHGRSDRGDACTPDDQPMTKFYTYQPDYSRPGAPHPRRDRVDLDARGAKAMPQPCITCHGGKLRPLDRFGRFVAMHAEDADVQVGDTKARLQAFEVDTFEFSDEAGHRRVDYEEGLRLLNLAVYCSYPDSFDDGDATELDCSQFGDGVVEQANDGEWNGDFARDMLVGWYRGKLDRSGGRYDGRYVPAGWKPAAGGPPAGADSLFVKVVGPNCFVCHGKRGNRLASNNDPNVDGKDIDFSTWEKFISHADEIERLVFDEGKMPMGLLNYNNFWNDPEKAELLASFIAPYVSDSSGFAARRTDSSGNILLPGARVVARAGPDRVTRPGAAITLNAQASLFADSYRWELLSKPTGASASLSRSRAMRTDFSANTDGEYKIRLTASSSETGSKRRDTLVVVVDSALAIAPRNLLFYPDIEGPLYTDLNNCANNCHADGNQPGIPVWWVEDGMQPTGVGVGVPSSTAEPPALGFYEQVMARVNFEHIEDSLMLKKPAGIHHFGGATAIGLGFDISFPVGSFDRRNYDMIVNWIAEGAACGGTAEQCVR